MNKANRKHEPHRYYHCMGARPDVCNGQPGVSFAVWAPNAAQVYVVGDFNGWRCEGQKMEKQDGVWRIFIPGAAHGDHYKYEIHTRAGKVFLKADPCAFFAELRPGTASRVWNLSGYAWKDDPWREKRVQQQIQQRPVLIYEAHLGSWKRNEDGSFLSYREIADELPAYAKEMGYTHIELLPLAEHPLDQSWGYQATGYYAATSRYGEPQDLMYFIDCCHQLELGVILDWAPGHFCRDDHGLRLFDGTPLYEYADWRKGDNRQWGTLNFDYGRPEVRDFLIGNALFWFDMFHIDGLRVDAVANMLYLDYGREQGEWLPNRYGGNENLEAIDLLRKLNEAVFAAYPGVMMIAEESTAWPLVSRPTYLGGLGFNFKWNMGWMNDILRYFGRDPLYRRWHHNALTFSLTYVFTEHFILPLSHDEVVHGKKSLLDKMPGDYWQKFANLRLLFAYTIAHPGKKLLFMGGEFGQFVEWRDWSSLDWQLLDYPQHRGMQKFVQELNRYYCQQPAFWEQDDSWKGFSWIDCENHKQSVLVFVRHGCNPGNTVIVVCNFTPMTYCSFRVGVTQKGHYREQLNSDDFCYGGSGQRNTAVLIAEEIAWHGQPYSLQMTIPPLAVVFLERISPQNTVIERGSSNVEN